MAIYIFTRLLTRKFFDILPKETNSPKGRENSRVKKNISTETSIPFPNKASMVDIGITKVHPFIKKAVQSKAPSS